MGDLICLLATVRTLNTCNPQNRIRINFDQKGIEIVHLWLLNTHYLMKRAVPLRPQEIIHFCKFRPPQKGPEIIHI